MEPPSPWRPTGAPPSAWPGPPLGSQGSQRSRGPASPPSAWSAPPVLPPGSAWRGAHDPQGGPPAAPPAPPHRPRRRRWRVLAALTAVVLVGGAAAGAAWWQQRPADPTAVALPATPTAVEEQTALRTYLTTGPGAAIVAFAQAADTDLPAARADRCGGLTQRLAQAGEPRQLLDAAAGVPHPDTRDAAVNAVGDMLAFVGACGQGGGEADADDAQFSIVVLRRLLEAQGVPA